MQGFAVKESLVNKLSKFEFKTKSKLSVVTCTRSKYYKKWYHVSAILNVICLFIALYYFFFIKVLDLDLFQTPKTFLVIFRTFWKRRPTERKKNVFVLPRPSSTTQLYPSAIDMWINWKRAAILFILLNIYQFTW